MSSILTNNSAMVALDTLRNINRSMGEVQSEISTGKTISNAKDNAALWAVSTTMSTDVDGFKQIQDSLARGSSAVGVARQASEQITDELRGIKELIIQAQSEDVNRSTIDADIDKRVETVRKIVGAAQFNGLNMIDGSSVANVNVLASLDRSADGKVSSSNIEVVRQNLSLTGTATAASPGTTAVTTTAFGEYTDAAGTAATTGTATKFAGAGTEQTSTFKINGSGTGVTYTLSLDDTDAGTGGTDGAAKVGKVDFRYVAAENDSAVDVAQALEAQISTYIDNFDLDAGANGAYSITRDGNELTLSFTQANGKETMVNLATHTGGTAATQSGGLSALTAINVTTGGGATSALTSIETMLGTSIDAAAAFGSSQAQIDSQSDFVGSLSDALTTGIGAIVDADMEAASARLQALQVQQQLGTQALSIANQAPQQLLSLFR